MSGTKVNDYSISDTNIETLMLTTDQIFKGKCQCTLTEMDTTTVPEIAAGSYIEVAGTLFKFDSDESISTTDPVTSSTVADGTVYVMIVPSTDTCTAAFTATAPTWSDSKQGWYGAGAYASYRYVGGCTKATSSYTYKFVFLEKNGLGLKYFRNSFSLGTMEDLSFKTLTIEDLQMYAIGEEILYTGIRPAYNSYSSKITIKKPCIIYLKNNSTNAVSQESKLLWPGYYYIHGQSADSVRMHKSIDGTTTNTHLIHSSVDDDSSPSGLSFGVATGVSISIICTYAEGLSTLDADLIVE